jgi:hypothetical protein
MWIFTARGGVFLRAPFPRRASVRANRFHDEGQALSNRISQRFPNFRAKPFVDAFQMAESETRIDSRLPEPNPAVTQRAMFCEFDFHRTRSKNHGAQKLRPARWSNHLRRGPVQSDFNRVWRRCPKGPPRVFIPPLCCLRQSFPLRRRPWRFAENPPGVAAGADRRPLASGCRTGNIASGNRGS